MFRSTLQCAVAAASLAPAMPATAAPIGLDFTATINYHYNYQAQQQDFQYVGQQVTGTLWLSSAVGAPNAVYDGGVNYSYQQWYAQTGCGTVAQGNCSYAYNPAPLAVLGYELNLPTGTVHQGSLMHGALWATTAGIAKQVWSGWEHMQYWNQAWVQHNSWGAADFSYEAQGMSLSASGSDLFTDLGNPLELPNLSNAAGKSVNFFYYLQTCQNDGYGANCNYYAPGSMSLNMTFDKLSVKDVPEPGTIGLLGLGLAGIALLRRRAAK